MYTLTITMLDLAVVYQSKGTLPELLGLMESMRLLDVVGKPRLDRLMLPAYSTVANYIKARRYYLNSIDAIVVEDSPEAGFPVIYVIRPVE